MRQVWDFVLLNDETTLLSGCTEMNLFVWSLDFKQQVGAAIGRQSPRTVSDILACNVSAMIVENIDLNLPVVIFHLAVGKKTDLIVFKKC